MDKMEEYGPARKEYEKALDLGSDSLVAHFRLGFFLAEEGNREGAMSHLAAAVTADPKKFVPYLFKEVQKVHSQLDCIRYTEPFTELLNRYREFWIQGKEESPGPDQPIPGEAG